MTWIGIEPPLKAEHGISFRDASLGKLPPNEVYAFRFGSRVSGNIEMMSDTTGMVSATSKTSDTPFITAEMGGGVQDTYHRRPVIHADDIAAMVPVIHRTYPSRRASCTAREGPAWPAPTMIASQAVHRTHNKKTIARPTAITSSSKAAGRSRPNADANLARIVAPPKVPNIAPMTPRTNPNNIDPADAPIVAPVRAPLKIRPMNCGGVFRLGVFGNLSLTNSKSASAVRMIGVYL
jgi:hypothetical protein